MKPQISIVIPVKNGSATIMQCLQAIRDQSIYDQVEIIIIDSGSTDGTLKIIKNEKVKVIEIDPGTFNHGGTRNLGVQYSLGEFVVMTVQDAIATDDKWLETMVAHFKDPEVVGVCGQQIVPHDLDKNPHEWFRPQSKPQSRAVQFKTNKEFNSLAAKNKRDLCGWDNVNAMYRISILEKIPFSTVAFGEDMLWAKQVLQQGYKLVYDSTAKVNHYHFQFPQYTFRRTLIAKVFIYKSIGYAQSETFQLKDYFLVVYRNFKWGCHPKWILHNFAIIYQQRKATKIFIAAIKNNKLQDLEDDLVLNVPIGLLKRI